MNLIWSIQFFIYQLCFPLLAFGIIIQFLKGGRGSKLAEGPHQLRQRFGLLSRQEIDRLAGGPVLWVHAASVGEVNAAAPLLKAIRASQRSFKILLTTSTAAGREQAGSLAEVDLAVLAPIDFYLAVKQFLGRSKPSRLILVETELWPAMLHLARKAGVRIALINGRMTERAYERYGWISLFIGRIIRMIDLAAFQTKDDAKRFVELGLPESSALVTGNLKYDTHPADEKSLLAVRSVIGHLGWTGDPILVAGSTRPEGEEEAVIDAFCSARQRHANLRLILAPRHVERSGNTAELLNKKKVRFTVLSSLTDAKASTAPPAFDCLLVSQMGLLSAFYAIGSIAFVGGTLVSIGGHNLLEPAIEGRPVIFGPHTESVAEVARILESAEAGFRVKNAAEFIRILDQFLSYPTLLEKTGRKARETAEYLSGATRRTMDFLSPFLNI